MMNQFLSTKRQMQEKGVKAARPSFVSAYRYCYGATIQEAEKAYRNADASYTWAVVESFKTDARSAFYND